MSEKGDREKMEGGTEGGRERRRWGGGAMKGEIGKERERAGDGEREREGEERGERGR